MVKIIADTTSSIPTDVANHLGIPYMPQIIIFGDESYRDDTEIDSQTFINKLKSSKSLPKTAAPPPALYTPFYEQFSAEGQSMIVICPSAELSGTVRSATVAAQDFPNADIRIIDSKTLGSGLGSMVFLADEWAKAGMDADTIEARIKDMISREQTYFLVDTLEYLYKGGRIGGAQALFGSILQVKPILTIKNGRAEPVESQRTKARAVARAYEFIEEFCPKDENAHISVMVGDAMEDAKNLASHITQILGCKDVPIYQLPPAIMVHAGPGCLAVSFFRKA